MAIVMLASFEPRDLPGVHPSRLFPLMDTGSYREAWTAVRQVSSNCISPFLTANRTLDPDLGASNFVSETGYSDFGMYSCFRVISCDLADDPMRQRAERRYWCLLMGYRLCCLPRYACSQLLCSGQ